MTVHRPAATVAAEPDSATSFESLLNRDQLVAWCIVPFDSRQRSPAERAAMVRRLGLKRVAYDWRAEHVPQFEEEILQYREHGIEFFAFWGIHDEALRLFEKYQLQPQIWYMLPQPAGENDAERLAAAVAALQPLVDRTRAAGLKLGLYNHGGWTGEPQNLVAICRELRTGSQNDHVGIVYNLHHGHDHLDGFAESLAAMEPYLHCLNLNGMNRNGDKQGQKILPIGAGSEDLQLLQVIQQSAYRGPIGVIGHTQDDVELRLLDNLEGLDWLRPQLRGEVPPQKVTYRTWIPGKAVPVP